MGPGRPDAPGRRRLLRGAIAALLIPLLARAARALGGARPPAPERPPGREARHWNRIA